MAFNSQARIEQEERELEELLKQQNRGKPEPKKEDPEEEEENEETPAVSTDTEEKPKSKLKEETPDEGGDDDGNFKKRYGDLRRYQQKRDEEHKAEQQRKDEEHKAEIAELKAQLEELQEKQVAASLPASESELEEWKETNPNAFAVVETLATKIAEGKFKDYKKELDEIKTSVTKDKTDLQKERALIKIKKAHPDFDELQESDEFNEWVDRQPKTVQKVIDESEDPDEVIWALDMYKLITEDKPKRKKKSTEAAEAVDAKGQKSVPNDDATKGMIRESEIEAMSDAEYAEREDEIRKAQRSGKIIYDISGGAR